jgi:aminoglycoside/choline kinase family phosphotransferase
MSPAGNQAPTESESRLAEAAAWAASVLGNDSVNLAPVSGDASFRRYFRLESGGRSLILMDAPPDREDSAPFLDVAKRLHEAGLRAPQIIHFDLQRGLGLLEDFGDVLYREIITADSVDALFPELFHILARMAHEVRSEGLPPYNPEFLGYELDLFRRWYLEVHRRRPLSDAEAAAWGELCQLLIDAAADQPQAFVHRDFHSCNLLATPDGPGIIDFQDAMCGPLNYDFVSLIWDRYIDWPRQRLEQWMAGMRTLLAPDYDPAEWIRSCDWMGLQRNLKVAGIFARLHYRDRKPGYLDMIPRFYGYLLDVTRRYPEFRDARRLLEQPECAP